MTEYRAEMTQEWMDQRYQNTKHNLSPWTNQIILLRGKSQNVLPNLLLSMQNAELPRFDLVVIDGDHRADSVYEDAVNSYMLVKRGGWLMFDDVRYARRKKQPYVREGLQRFLDEYGMRVKQAWSHRYMECYERVE
jgi:predicted O-methyltransferase YrrM